jgi:predicted phage-related endonuclease
MPALTAANDLIRARNVSASEVYALMGKHPYSSPQKIYDRLMSPGPDLHNTSTEAMSLGSYMEPYIARFAAQAMGVKVRACIKTYEHKKVSLCATPDYYIIGKPMLLEVKVSSIMYGWTDDDLHPHYEYQARAQMACTKRDTVFVVAMVGARLYRIPVTRDLAKERRMLDAVETFWHENIIPGNRPGEQTHTSLTAIVA